MFIYKMYLFILPAFLSVWECKSNFSTALYLLHLAYGEVASYPSLALFPGLPRLRFLIACSMQKQSQKAWWILPRDPRHGDVTDSRHGNIYISSYREAGEKDKFQPRDKSYL